MPAVTPATLKRAATNFAAWWTDARWVWTVCLRLLPDRVVAEIWIQHANHSATKPPARIVLHGNQCLWSFYRLSVSLSFMQCFLSYLFPGRDVLRNCNVSTDRPLSSLYWFYVSTVYVSLGLRADTSAVHPPVCPACCTVYSRDVTGSQWPSDPVTRESSDPETQLTRWPCSKMNSRYRLMCKEVFSGQKN